MSYEDARRVLREHGVAQKSDSGTGHFRSEVFGRLPYRPLSVEVFGGFHVREGATWREVRPLTRVAVAVPAGSVFVPALPDLIDITRLLGRAKDLARAEMLSALLAMRSDDSPGE